MSTTKLSCYQSKGEILEQSKEPIKESIIQGPLYWITDLQANPGDGDVIKSELYFVEGLKESLWQIELDPNYVKDGPAGVKQRYLSVWVKLLAMKADSLRIHARISIMESVENPDSEVYGKVVSLLELKENMKFGFKDFLPIYQLSCDPSNKFLFRIDFTAFFPVLPEMRKVDEFKVEDEKDEGLYFQNSYHCEEGPPHIDAFLQIGPNRVIPVDSGRLSACSPVFREYFEREDTKMVPMDLTAYFDESSFVLAKFIVTCCHVGKMEKNQFPSKARGSGGMIKLLKAATALKIYDLIDKCTEVLLAKLSVNSLPHVVELIESGVIDYSIAAPTIRDFMIQNFDKLQRNQNYRRSYKTHEDNYAFILMYDLLREGVEDVMDVKIEEMDVDEDDDDDSDAAVDAYFELFE